MHTPITTEFHLMLAELDAAFPGSIYEEPENEHYFRLRDEALEFVDSHPEVRDAARDAGLPVD